MKAGCALAAAVSLFAGGPPTQKIKRAADTTPPVVRIISPAPAARVDSATPSIDIAYDDDGSGVSVVTFRATVNGRDYSAAFEHDSHGATAKIAATHPLPLGDNHLVVEVADRMGNMARAESTFVNAAGGWLRVSSAPGVGPKRVVELVLDASGSMNDKVLDTTRMALAKGAVKNLITRLPDALPLGFRVFTDCGKIARLLPIAKVDKPAFLAVLDGVRPTGGTPIVASLLQSFDALDAFTERERVAVLVTDGGESCNGSFEEAARRAAQQPAIRVVIIGFNLGDKLAVERLRRFAEGTGGAFFDAQDGDQVQAALERSVTRVTFGVFDKAGVAVGRGEVNGDPVMLPLGALDVRFDLSSPKLSMPIEVLPLATVRLRLLQAGSGVSADIDRAAAVEDNRPRRRSMSEGRRTAVRLCESR